MLTALLVIARTAQIGVSVLLAGIFTFELLAFGLAGRAASDDCRGIERCFFRLAVWSLVVSLLSALFWFWLEVAAMSGVSLTNALSTTAWQTVLFETKFGRVWQLRLGLIVVAFALAAPRLAGGEVRRRGRILVLWFISVVLLVSLAWISHAAAARVQPLGLLGDAVHLCAAGGWIGGLAPLAIFLRRAHVSFSLGAIAAPVLQRFSTFSLCCVSVLVVSGISNSWLLVESVHALLTTRYGWLLLSKLTLFGILIGFGARNRFVVKTKLPGPPAGPDLLRQLRRNVICEACLGLVIVAIVACLGVTPPTHRL
jgi:putative copper resistance protein D